MEQKINEINEITVVGKFEKEFVPNQLRIYVYLKTTDLGNINVSKSAYERYKELSEKFYSIIVEEFYITDKKELENILYYDRLSIEPIIRHIKETNNTKKIGSKVSQNISIVINDEMLDRTVEIAYSLVSRIGLLASEFSDEDSKYIEVRIENSRFEMSRELESENTHLLLQGATKDGEILAKKLVNVIKNSKLGQLRYVKNQYVSFGDTNIFDTYGTRSITYSSYDENDIISNVQSTEIPMFIPNPIIGVGKIEVVFEIVFEFSDLI